MKKSIIIGIGLIFVLLLAACGGNASNESEAKDIKEKVHEYSVGNFKDVSASITSSELIVTENNKETSYKLPKEEFFVSIAPYIDTTHPCDNHSLTGCQGELVEKEFDVFVQDEEGRVIIDEKMTSLENGFIDLWLPRNETFHVKIEHNGKSSKSEISTFDGDNTCITTMQLL